MVELKNRNIRLTGPLETSQMQFLAAKISEGLSKLTEITVEFLSDKVDTDLQDVLGELVTMNFDLEDGSERYFSGYCIAAEYVGEFMGLRHFEIELRPWFWFLKRSENNRIFQEKSTVDIIKEIFGDYGFSGNVTDELKGNYATRTYCVQYGESDFDFVSRLMEEEGIFFYFRHKEKGHNMVLAEESSGLPKIGPNNSIDFHNPDDQFRRDNDHLWSWEECTTLRSGKVTLKDYDFKAPRADQKKVKAIETGIHSYKSYERYRYPGHVRPPSDQDKFARVRMEAEAVKHKLSRGVGNVRELSVGSIFELTNHHRAAVNAEYVVVNAVHYLQTIERANLAQNDINAPDISRIRFEEGNEDVYRSHIEVIPMDTPFRAPLTTPWPRIAGMQTAVVTGPSGEEIYTDEYGRVKVKFHWDRSPEKEEKSTCWVRCVMPWTGKNWGMISIPRIGHEVVIQFEEGDPDRPICTGMLYNADNKPPYTLPSNKTQTGIVTRSTKAGGASTYNELIFEDKKDAEFVRLQSEKDFIKNIKNNATITIGVDKQDPGDLTQTVYHTKTETIQTGDHIFKVAEGNQTVDIKCDHTETIEGTSSQTITGNTEQTVEQGNYTQTISAGNVKRTISQGNESHTVKIGDWELTTTAGSVGIKAGTEISLTVGGNSITIDNAGIKIKGLMVEVSGQATVKVDSPMTTVAGDAVLTLDGGLTMIN